MRFSSHCENIQASSIQLLQTRSFNILFSFVIDLSHRRIAYQIKDEKWGLLSLLSYAWLSRNYERLILRENSCKL